MKCRTICSTNDGHTIVHSALNNSCMAMPAFQGPLVAALWDALDRNIFLLSSGKILHVFVLELTAINGPGEFPAEELHQGGSKIRESHACWCRNTQQNWTGWCLELEECHAMQASNIWEASQHQQSCPLCSLSEAGSSVNTPTALLTAQSWTLTSLWRCETSSPCQLICMEHCHYVCPKIHFMQHPPPLLACILCYKCRK